MTAAHELARRYDQAVAASWRGDEEPGRRFASWLASFWQPGGPAEPAGPPLATSVLSAGGRGVRWYGTASAVLGYVPGRPGCLRVPVSAAPPTGGDLRSLVGPC